MIDRYQDNNINNIWSQESIASKWLQLELLVLEGWHKHNLVSLSEFEKIKNNVQIDLKRWKEIESETKHEFTAFLHMLEESINDNSSKWIHFGLTSSDILDSATSIGLHQTLDYIGNILLLDFQKSLNRIKTSHGNIELCGRTHGQIAEKQFFGDVLDRWLSELRRCQARLYAAQENISILKLSGPVGNYSTITKDIEKFVCLKLGFEPAINSSQIISRDIFADYFYSITMLASLLEKIATYIRLLSLSGIDELHEGFSNNQVGSSAMPHKRNPILCENICGISRMIKSYLITAIDNNNSWLERDMSHSSIERITIPDTAHLISHGIKTMINILNNLIVNSDNMKTHCDQNINRLQSHTNMLDAIKNKNTTRKVAHESISSKF